MEFAFQTSYETGNHRIYRLCCRYWITGPFDDYPVQLACFIAFAFALVAWVVLCVYFIWYTNSLFALVPLFSHVLAFICYLVAACNDPGIVPKRPNTTPTRETHPEGGPIRWCESCSQEKMDGTYHCDYCNVCTLELDHHCGVIGNCVGARNKFIFIGLLGFCQLFFSYAFINLILSLAYTYVAMEPSQRDAFDVANWVIASVELASLCVVIVDVVLNHWGFGQSGSAVERVHRKLWFWLDNTRGTGKLFLNVVPRSTCTMGGGKRSLLHLQRLYKEDAVASAAAMQIV